MRTFCKPANKWVFVTEEFRTEMKLLVVKIPEVSPLKVSRLLGEW